MSKRTEKRVANRKIVASELLKIRHKKDQELRYRTGMMRATHIEQLCIAIFGVFDPINRSALCNLERGNRSFDLVYFNVYLKTLGYTDKEVGEEFRRIVCLLVC